MLSRCIYRSGAVHYANVKLCRLVSWPWRPVVPAVRGLASASGVNKKLSVTSELLKSAVFGVGIIGVAAGAWSQYSYKSISSKEVKKGLGDSPPKGSHEYSDELLQVTYKDRSIASLIGAYTLLRMAEVDFVMDNMTTIWNGAKAIGLRTLAERFFLHTVFGQYVAGSDYAEANQAINTLSSIGVAVMVDSSSEGEKGGEEGYDHAMQSILIAIGKATHLPLQFKATPIGVTALGDVSALERFSAIVRRLGVGCFNKALGQLGDGDRYAIDRLVARMNRLCSQGKETGVRVCIAAEDSTTLDAVHELGLEMMRRHNTDTVNVYGVTCQMYLQDGRERLEKCISDANEKGYCLGVTLVRGAYVEGERRLAEEGGYKSPIWSSKEESDRCFDEGATLLLDNIGSVDVIYATHNEHSISRICQTLEEKGLSPSHPHVRFAHLYGMSDCVTSWLALRGYNAVKLVPVMPVDVAIPYLLRRLEENKAVKERAMSERDALVKELKRRLTGPCILCKLVSSP